MSEKSFVEQAQALSKLRGSVSQYVVMRNGYEAILESAGFDDNDPRVTQAEQFSSDAYSAMLKALEEAES